MAHKNHGMPENINISPKILENIKITNEIKKYNFLSDETNLIYFVLKLLFEIYSKSIKELKIYQIGLKTIDEPLFIFVISYFRKTQISTLLPSVGGWGAVSPSQGEDGGPRKRGRQKRENGKGEIK